MEVIPFTIQKIGEDKKSNQDYYHCSIQKDVFALSDGVSRSSFSDIWSKKIVDEFIQNPFNSPKPDEVFLERWLKSAKLKFEEEISKLNVNPMILDVAKENGSAATFLGCKINKSKKNKKISIWAIGDTNIFQIRDKKIINLFPIKKVEGFSFRTPAISSFIENQKTEFLYAEWIIKNDDVILMATDAFSKWFLDSSNKGQKPWKKIIRNNSKLNDFVETIRIHNKIENDDTTFILIKF
ncbi:MAG: hypothetical protein K8Q89_02150 [Nitrosarchaeum sp.]|nr:hypothetical protein [Nitrosarchaeum sp.]